MSESFAFFDTCSRQPSKKRPALVIANNMGPVKDKLKEIYATAERLDAPVLSTTCLSFFRGNPGMSMKAEVQAMAGGKESTGQRKESEVAFVPMEATPEEVAHARTCHYIVIDRLSLPTPQDNTARRTFDPFFINTHTADIVRGFGDRHWLVFGAGFEHCLLSTAVGLRSLGLRVTVLEDGVIHGGISTPETFIRTLEQMKSAGVEWATLESVLAGSPAFAAIPLDDLSKAASV